MSGHRSSSPAPDSEPERESHSPTHSTSSDIQAVANADGNETIVQLLHALRALYQGPEYANGGVAHRLPILRRFHPKLRPPFYVVPLNASERTQVNEFTRGFRRTACTAYCVDTASVDPMYEEMAYLLAFLCHCIAALARVSLG